MSYSIKEAIVITGATSGIGLATVKLLAPTQPVIALGRNAVQLAQLKSEYPNVVGLVGDLLNDDVPAYIEEIAEELDLSVTTIIHSAGVGLSQRFDRYDPVAVHNLFKVNVYSAFAIIDKFLPKMLDLKKGNVCLISSTAGLYGYKYNGAYCATKHSLVGMVKSLAQEHGKRGIVATAICPGVVDTPMTHKTIAGLMKYQGLTIEAATAKLAALNPQNRIIPAEEVAEAIVFACSGKVPSLNGSALVLGGGE